MLYIQTCSLVREQGASNTIESRGINSVKLTYRLMILETLIVSSVASTLREFACQPLCHLVRLILCSVLRFLDRLKTGSGLGQQPQHCQDFLHSVLCLWLFLRHPQHLAGRSSDAQPVLGAHYSITESPEDPSCFWRSRTHYNCHLARRRSYHALDPASSCDLCDTRRCTRQRSAQVSGWAPRAHLTEASLQICCRVSGFSGLCILYRVEARNTKDEASYTGGYRLNPL